MWAAAGMGDSRGAGRIRAARDTHHTQDPTGSGKRAGGSQMFVCCSCVYVTAQLQPIRHHHSDPGPRPSALRPALRRPSPVHHGQAQGHFFSSGHVGAFAVACPVLDQPSNHCFFRSLLFPFVPYSVRSRATALTLAVACSSPLKRTTRAALAATCAPTAMVAACDPLITRCRPSLQPQLLLTPPTRQMRTWPTGPPTWSWTRSPRPRRSLLPRQRLRPLFRLPLLLSQRPSLPRRCLRLPLPPPRPAPGPPLRPAPHPPFCRRRLSSLSPPTPSLAGSYTSTRCFALAT